MLSYEISLRIPWVPAAGVGTATSRPPTPGRWDRIEPQHPLLREIPLDIALHTWGTFAQQPGVLLPANARAANRGFVGVLSRSILTGEFRRARRASGLGAIEAIARATTDEEEEITKELIESVAQDRLRYVQRFLNVLRKNNHEELKRYEDIAPLNLEFAVNEAVNTLRRRQEGATTSTDAGEGWTNEREGKTNGSVDTNIEQKPQGTASLEKRADTGEAKPVLIQAFDKGELDGIVGYEVLKASGHTRPAEEYHKAEAETGGEPEALSA